MRDTFSFERPATLRIKDFLEARVDAVTVQLVGREAPALARVGSVLVYVPLLVVGYLLVIAAAARGLATFVGWSWALCGLGLAHLAMGLAGVVRGRTRGLVDRSEVYDPDVVTGVSDEPAGSSARRPDRPPPPPFEATLAAAFRTPPQSFAAAMPADDGAEAPAPRGTP